MFFLTLFALMALGDVVWWRWADTRLRRLTRHRRAGRLLLAAFMGGLLSYLLAVFLLPQPTRRSDGPIPMPLHAAAFLWHMLFLPVLLLLSLTAGLGQFARAIGRRFSTSRPQRLSEAGQEHSRREILAAAAVGLPPLALAVTTGAAIAQLGNIRIRRFDLSLPQLPPALDGMTIAHVSDLHVGKFTRDGSLSRLADMVNAMKCDFVAVTGDLIDLALADLPRALAMVRQLDPRQGLFICEGNHDLIEDRGEFETRMATSGLPFLLQNERTIQFRGEPVQFLGTRWAHADAELADSVVRMRPTIRPDAFPILLAHHPHAFDAAAAVGIPLTLSGHTHGGQIMLNERLGFGPVMFRYWSGLYQKNASSLIVSNGAGNWFPLRIGAPAELVQITLRTR
jgi:predicted MPP superfamily phosphohydrolase